MNRSKASLETMNKLVIALREKKLSIADCLQITGLEKDSKGKSILTGMLINIGNHYPLYQPEKCYYKILTDKDIEDYRTQLRLEKKNARAKMG